MTRMSGEQRRAQVLAIAAREFADHGLHGASTETVARAAGITQAYIFRMFGTKKALFCELVGAAFDRFSTGMAQAAAGRTGRDALTQMGGAYYDLLADRTTLLLQLQGLAACGDPEVRDQVRAHFARLWSVVAEGAGLEPVTIKAFLAFGLLLDAGAALDVEELTDDWALGVRTRIQPGLFDHISTATNR